ncbi:hypothetical protein PG997_004614 [Apiospora hydei]|uniref:Uncharacterized protein n=1 Tax=Apiospora hydei TaxID=1337664 RepID=A0ABR1X2K8_9PEZI
MGSRLARPIIECRKVSRWVWEWMGVESGCRDVEGPDMAQRVGHLSPTAGRAPHWLACLCEISPCDLSRQQGQRTGKAAAMGHLDDPHRSPHCLHRGAPGSAALHSRIVRAASG